MKQQRRLNLRSKKELKYIYLNLIQRRSTGVFLLFVTIIFLVRSVIPRFKIVQKLTDKLNGVARKNLTGIRVVRTFNAENYQENKFDADLILVMNNGNIIEQGNHEKLIEKAGFYADLYNSQFLRDSHSNVQK